MLESRSTESFLFKFSLSKINYAQVNRDKMQIGHGKPKVGCFILIKHAIDLQ